MSKEAYFYEKRHIIFMKRKKERRITTVMRRDTHDI